MSRREAADPPDPREAADPPDRPGTARPGTARRIVGSDGRAKVYRPLDEATRRAAREAGLAAYAEGRFFEAHELIEPAWMGSSDPAERDLDQGIIKLAAAYVHAERGNPLGMRKNLLGARRRLAALGTEHREAGRQASERAQVDAPLLLQRVEDSLARLEEYPARSDGGGPLLELIPPPAIPRMVPGSRSST